MRTKYKQLILVQNMSFSFYLKSHCRINQKSGCTQTKYSYSYNVPYRQLFILSYRKYDITNTKLQWLTVILEKIYLKLILKERDVMILIMEWLLHHLYTLVTQEAILVSCESTQECIFVFLPVLSTKSLNSLKSFINTTKNCYFLVTITWMIRTTRYT